ncbi:helix-turn-helix domain-containing protein [Maritimibacter sp. DP1N21-5]|uniref:helix-turn-helix domain-containing protein n=1 Tax=Maritimibacter sp. DP1N21-5 TaxID=2836867 RepID=UPI001C46AACF|nr:helix-turn-helix domain-containing protein [Maritimibacter sp. DP1N21-5]MBV7410299.1 helix-turn-helix domain-containing protein [Maritimibacter sp. DP1N21-5]
MDDNWYSDEAATFGDRLAAARDNAGLTQKDLAKRIGVKTKTLCAWEDDLTEPRANRLQMISGVLGVSLGWLLTGVGDGVTPPDDIQELTPAAKDILLEIRELRGDMSDASKRLATLEKRLRRVLEAG